MRGIRFGFILAIVFSSLTACLRSSDCSREDVFCAGLVTDTLGIEDHGINQDAWAGLQNAKANGSVDQIAYIESVDTRDYEKNVAYFAERGYDVIITSGVGQRDETLRGADLYADVVFVGINQPQKETRPNLIPVTFAEDQMGYIAGVMAVRVTKTGSVAAICETSGIDAMWRTCEGFRAGVNAARADKAVKLAIIYHDSGDSEKLFIDETWGHDTAQDLIKRGTDVIFAAGGVTGQGALRAAIESKIKAIGAERDQAAVLEESNSWVITSVYGDAQAEVENITRLLKGGNISGLSPSRIKFVPFGPKIPENLTQEINGILTKLWNGKIKTFVTTTKP